MRLRLMLCPALLSRWWSLHFASIAYPYTNREGVLTTNYVDGRMVGIEVLLDTVRSLNVPARKMDANMIFKDTIW
jgi:hypothetical protein